MFQGNDVKDEHWDMAFFANLTSAPSSMEALKCADAYGLLPGHSTETSDAEQAFAQSLLGGTETWVRLPKDRWPQERIDRGMTDPVVPLLLALYDHPDSGGALGA